MHPGVVSGPLLTKASGGSVQTFQMIMSGKLFSIPQVYFPCVDVRDVAEAHVRSLTMAKNGERYAITQGTYFLPDLGKVMYDEFSKHGHKCSTRKMGKTTAWLASFVNQDAKGFYNDWGVNCHIKNDKSVKDLKMEYRPINESLKDMGYSLIEHGLVPNLKKN